MPLLLMPLLVLLPLLTRYTPDECVAMIAAAIDAHLGTRDEFDLVIHDWGAYWGYLYAGQNPSRVRRLVVSICVGCNV